MGTFRNKLKFILKITAPFLLYLCAFISFFPPWKVNGIIVYSLYALVLLGLIARLYNQLKKK